MEELITRPQMRAILWRWGHALETVAGYERDLKALRSMIQDAYDTLGAPRMDGAPSGGGHADIVARASERVERRVSEYRKVEQSTLRLATERLALKRLIDVEVARLSDIEQQVLRMRYQTDNEWVYIAFKLSYSEQHVRAIETRAVDRLRGVGEIIELASAVSR